MNTTWFELPLLVVLWNLQQNIMPIEMMNMVKIAVTTEEETAIYTKIQLLSEPKYIC